MRAGEPGGHDGQRDRQHPSGRLRALRRRHPDGVRRGGGNQGHGDDHRDPARVFDTDVRIPGFTFAAVGDVPSAVVTPLGDPAHKTEPLSSFTYVLNRGSSSLSVINTTKFRGPTGADATLGGGADYFPADSRPTAMELSPDQSELIITLPSLGEVWFAPIDGATVSPPVRVALTSDVPAAVDFTAGVDLPPPYEYVCDLDAAEVPRIPPRDPVSLGSTPEPWGLAIDAENGRVLVADRNLPIIHVIDLATHAELDPINVQVPTRQLAISPNVPSGQPETLSGNPPRDSRFLYAIDETDQSVLAVDYASPGSPSFGGVLPVTPTGTVNRIQLPATARALEVVAPRYLTASNDYTGTGDLSLCNPSDLTTVSTGQLHGVFLAVATSDGQIRIVDILDLDASCRGSDSTCRDGDANAQDVGAAIGRNRPRIGSVINQPTTALQINPAPAWTSGTTTLNVSADGSAGSGYPALTPVTCPSGLGPVYSSSANLVCMVVNPWAAQAQTFEAAWNGTVPHTGASGGQLSSEGTTIDVRFDPCELGIIGSEQVPSSGYLSNYGGDVVAITGAVAPSVGDGGVLAADCAALLQTTASGDTTPVLLPILRAYSITPDTDASTSGYRGRLEMGPPTNVDGTSMKVAQCFSDSLQFEVRANRVYLVQSGSRGFRSPIAAGDGGACTVDPARPERGRAFPGTLFQTDEIAFQIAGSVTTPGPTDQAALTMTLNNVPAPLTYDVTITNSGGSGSTNLPSLLTALRYNPYDERLYVVNQATRGLIRLNLTSTTHIEATFQ